MGTASFPAWAKHGFDEAVNVELHEGQQHLVSDWLSILDVEEARGVTRVEEIEADELDLVEPRGRRR